MHRRHYSITTYCTIKLLYYYIILFFIITDLFYQVIKTCFMHSLVFILNSLFLPINCCDIIWCLIWVYFSLLFVISIHDTTASKFLFLFHSLLFCCSFWRCFGRRWFALASTQNANVSLHFLLLNIWYAKVCVFKEMCLKNFCINSAIMNAIMKFAAFTFKFLWKSKNGARKPMYMGRNDC